MKVRKICGGANAPRGQRSIALIAAATLLAAPAAAASDEVTTAHPALWVVRDHDTTIYLFGTFHALSPNIRWLDGKVATAFKRSDSLVLETIVPASPKELETAGTRAMAGRPRDFIKATSSTIRQGAQVGLTVSLGADAVLRRAADEAGKAVSGLEGFEEQLAILANIPSAPPASAITAPQPAAPSVSMNDLLKSWKSGDDKAFAAMLANFEAKSPVAYRMLIADRNAKWERRIEAMLDRPGRTFVAVGAGHLSGRDSVIALLKARGLKVRRIA